jgi:hypothetical protein
MMRLHLPQRHDGEPVDRWAITFPSSGAALAAMPELAHAWVRVPGLGDPIAVRFSATYDLT